MKTRLIIHYLDGRTYTGDWNTHYLFRDLNTKPISSLQIQSFNKLYTLSSKKKDSQFFSRGSKDHLSILRYLDKYLWIELRVDKNTGESKINIIEEYIENI